MGFILKYDKNLNCKILVDSSTDAIVSHLSTHTICLICNYLKMFFAYADGLQQNQIR